MEDMKNTQETTLTGPHRELIAFLKGMGYRVEDERAFPPYSVDCYIEKLHMGFEADGPQHMKKHDKTRDQILMRDYALPIIRMKSDELASSEVMYYFVEKVLDSAWGNSAKSRRKYATDLGWEG